MRVVHAMAQLIFWAGVGCGLSAVIEAGKATNKCGNSKLSSFKIPSCLFYKLWLRAMGITVGHSISYLHAIDSPKSHAGHNLDECDSTAVAAQGGLPPRIARSEFIKAVPLIPVPLKH